MKNKNFYSRALRSFIAAIIIAGIAMVAQAVIIGNLDYNILSEEDRTVDVAWPTRGASKTPIDSLFIPSSVEIDGVNYSVSEIRESGFRECDKINNFISIPGSVKKIGAFAFDDLQYVDSIQLNEGLEIIGNDAFSTTMIKSVHLPESILEIGEFAFAGCNNLTYINWPDYITEIPNSCFRDCSSLKQWDFSNITKIGFLAFENCSSFENVVIPSGCYIDLGGLGGYRSEKLTFEPGPTVLKSGALAGGKFHKLELPEGITLYESVLDECINLRTLIINQGTNLIDRAFWEQNAYGPPDDWRWKGENLLALDSVVYLASEPERMPGDIFTPNVYKNAVLYVKPEALAKAKYTIPWRRFKRKEAISSSIKDVLNDDPDDSNLAGPTKIFTLSGLPCGNNPDKLPPGTYIIRDKNGSRKFHISKE
ncbi:MAG: leucine-rich repeat domain-containing protein [Muribaculaceae bacterium]|nr:leucine-rich repeat domain-containing protein [Muribaculaceae bacterium]